MLCMTTNNKYKFFSYKGKYYWYGTRVMLSDKYIEFYEKETGKKLWKYAVFGNRVVSHEIHEYFFTRYCENVRAQRSYQPYFTINELDLELAIQEIVYPIEVSRELIDEMIRPRNDFEKPEILIGWIIYIIVLIASLIFYQFYVIWIAASIIFFKWRREQLLK